jgi:nicotinate-nucleotide--dimethylbenzimidazole phosphoribosyltransferase
VIPDDIAALAASIPALDSAAMGHAVDRQLRLTKPEGSLGKLEGLSVWLCGVQGDAPPRPLANRRLVVLAGDHGVARLAVSAYPPEVTRQMVANFLAGGAACNVLARLLGVEVRVHDISIDGDVDGAPEALTRHKIRRGSGSIDREPALTDDEADAALRAGVAIADEAADEGVDVLIAGDMGIGDTTPAAALVCAFTGAEPVDAVGRGTGVDDGGWARKVAVVRDSLRRSRSRRNDAVATLAEIGGADFAVGTGLLLGAAARRTPVVLDGVVSGACALAAAAIAPGVRDYLVAGHVTTEPAHRTALDHLGLAPLLDLSLRLGEGTGALLALPLLDAAVAALREMSTFGEAGVSGPRD